MALAKNILVPTDFSEGAGQALDYAVELAGALGATIHLLNVIGVPMLGAPELGIAVGGAMLDSTVSENQIALDTLATSKRGAATIGQVVLRSGHARDMILETATELGVDLIVMGTHGRRGLSRALLGSIAETVVRMATCPVLTVRTRG